MKNKLLIIGASGHGKVVADVAMKMNKWNTIAFLDDDESMHSSMGLRVLGEINDADNFLDEYDIFVAIGNNRLREEVYKSLELKNANIPLLIHPNAVIGKQVEIGIGTVIMANAVINSDSQISKGCIVNTGATIDHDNIIGEYVHVSPGVHLAGTVQIDYRSWMGIGSIVNNNIHITNECKVGAGAVVINNLVKSGTYIGIPARRVEI